MIAPDQSATVRFFGVVDGDTAKAILSTLDSLVAGGCKKVLLLISTPGGGVHEGISVHNYLKAVPIEVTTCNYGSVDSIGTVIFSAGARRLSAPNARFLLHPVAFNILEKVSFEEHQLIEKLKSLQIDSTNIARIISTACGKPEKEVSALMSARTTWDPEQARAFGLVHDVRADVVPVGAKVIAIQK